MYSSDMWWRDKDFIAGLSVDRLEMILKSFGFQNTPSRVDETTDIFTKENKSIVMPSRNVKHVDNSRRWKVAFERVQRYFDFELDDFIAELRDDYD